MKTTFYIKMILSIFEFFINFSFSIFLLCVLNPIFIRYLVAVDLFFSNLLYFKNSIFFYPIQIYNFSVFCVLLSYGYNIPSIIFLYFILKNTIRFLFLSLPEDEESLHHPPLSKETEDSNNSPIMLSI